MIKARDMYNRQQQEKRAPEFVGQNEYPLPLYFVFMTVNYVIVNKVIGYCTAIFLYY